MHDNKTELMKYRLRMAKEQLESAKLLLDNGKLKDSVGRSYYAIFTSVRAVEFHNEVESYLAKNNIQSWRKNEIFGI